MSQQSQEAGENVTAAEGEEESQTSEQTDTDDCIVAVKHFSAIVEPSGKEVRVNDCIIEFDIGSFDRTTTVEGKLEIDRSKWPPGFLVITPMIYVKASSTLLMPASVQASSWCMSDGSNEGRSVKAYVFHLPYGSSTWDIIKILPFTDEKFFRFECIDFSPVCVGLEIDSLSSQLFKVDVSLYAAIDNTFTSTFCIGDEMIAQHLKETLSATGFRLIAQFNSVDAKIGDKLKGCLSCMKPACFSFIIGGDFALVIDKRFLTVHKQWLKKAILDCDQSSITSRRVALQYETFKNEALVDGPHVFGYNFNYEPKANPTEGSKFQSTTTFHGESRTYMLVPGVHHYAGSSVDKAASQVPRKMARSDDRSGHGAATQLSPSRETLKKVKETGENVTAADSEEESQTSERTEDESVSSFTNQLEQVSTDQESATPPAGPVLDPCEAIQRSVNKNERLGLFHKIMNLNSSEAARSIDNIDFSRIPLSSSDITAIGYVASMTTSLQSLNLRGCQMQKGSLIALKSQLVPGTTKIYELRVDENRNLSIDDLKAGMDICSNCGGVFMYENRYLSSKDSQELKTYKRRLQGSQSKFSSNKRKFLTKEERLQNLNNQGKFASDFKLQRCISDFSAISLSSMDERGESNTAMDRVSSREKTAEVQPQESDDTSVLPGDSASSQDRVSSRDELNAERTAESDDTSVLPGDSASSQASQGKRKYFTPRTVRDHVKYKPIQRFQQRLKEFEEGKMEPSLTKDLLNWAKKSDRNRFHSLAVKSFASSSYQKHIRDGQLQASTVLGKRSKGDSGYRTRSSLSSAMSDKASLRRQRNQEERGTQHQFLKEIKEVQSFTEQESGQGTEESAQASLGSTLQVKTDWNPCVVAKLKFQMTCRGLGVTEDAQQRLNNWLLNEDFSQVPSDDLDGEECAGNQMPSHAITGTTFPKDVSEDSMDNEEHPVRSDIADEKSLECDIERLQIEDESSENGSDEISEDSASESNYFEAWGVTEDEIEELIENVIIGPAEKTVKIGGCEITFPTDAVKEETSFRFAICAPTAEKPSSEYVGITPELYVESERQLVFSPPAIVRLKTWCAVERGSNVKASIQQKKSGADNWEEVTTSQITRDRFLTFKCSEFSGKRGQVKKSQETEVDFFITGSMYAEERRFILSIYPDDRTARRKSEKKVSKMKCTCKCELNSYLVKSDDLVAVKFILPEENFSLEPKLEDKLNVKLVLKKGQLKYFVVVPATSFDFMGVKFIILINDEEVPEDATYIFDHGWSKRQRRRHDDDGSESQGKRPKQEEVPGTSQQDVGASQGSVAAGRDCIVKKSYSIFG